jgi:hypothetical protein
MTSEIDKLKHFHVENYSGTNFTDDFEHKNNVLTGRYFNTCLLYEYDIDKGWMPKEIIYIY